MTGQRLELDLVWQDAMTLLRHNWRYSALVLAIFSILPGLVVGWLGPDPAAVGAAASAWMSDTMTNAHRTTLVQARLWSLPGVILSSVASAGLLAGWLARTAQSEGALLRTTFRLAPFAVVVGILSTLATAFGMLFLIIPGLFLLGRLALSLPALVDAGRPGFLAPLRRSFAVTRGNTLGIVGMIVGIIILWMIVSALIGGLIAAIANAVAGQDAASWLAAVPSALLNAGLLALLTAISAAIWRQLGARQAAA